MALVDFCVDDANDPWLRNPPQPKQRKASGDALGRLHYEDGLEGLLLAVQKQNVTLIEEVLDHGLRRILIRKTNQIGCAQGRIGHYRSPARGARHRCHMAYLLPRCS